jgi:hypothetical protein
MNNTAKMLAMEMDIVGGYVLPSESSSASKSKSSFNVLK